VNNNVYVSINDHNNDVFFIYFQMGDKPNSGKRFKKQHVQMASSDEKIRSEELEDIVCDPEASNVIRIVNEPSSWQLDDTFFPHGPPVHDFSIEKLNCANCGETESSTAAKCSNIRENQIGCVWFVPTQHLLGKTLKPPIPSSAFTTSISFDLFANFWNGQCVTIGPKSFRQIGIGHSLHRTYTCSDDRKCTRPNWYAQIVSTPAQESQGIFHGTGIIDPRNVGPKQRFGKEIVITLFNFSERPYAIYDKDLVGRLIFPSCFVPDFSEKQPLKFHFRGELQNI
jgi:hypothetical protein